MKDLHSHLLYKIDDGSKSIEESIELLKQMEKAGVKELILTPHYIENSKYNSNNRSKEALFKKLSKKAKDEKIDIKLYLGNEVFFTTEFLKLIESNEIKTLNDSKYILFEFPMNNIYNNTLQVVNELVSNGYTPILAHPERYITFQKKPKAIQEYLKSGILLQGNYTSLFGKYGRKSQKTLKFFLKNKWISFLGGDVHHDVNFDRDKLRKKLLRITKDEEYVEDLMNNNFDKVINNEDIGIIR